MNCSDKNNFILGASIGDSNITTAIIDLNNKEIINHTRIRLKLHSPAISTEILEILTSALKQAGEKFDLPVDRIAVAVPGPTEYENGSCLIKDLTKYEAIYDLNIKQHISRELNIKPENILFRNNTEAFLHGEIITGMEAGYQTVIGITIDQRLEAAKSILGVTKNINLTGSKLNDYITDESLSERFLLNRYFELTRKSILSVEALGRIAEKGDKIALLIFKQFTFCFCCFLKDIINAERPDVVVIGGNITKVSRLFFKTLTCEMAMYLKDIDIKIAYFGEDSVLIGAAAAFDVKRQQCITNVFINRINNLYQKVMNECLRSLSSVHLKIIFNFK